MNQYPFISIEGNIGAGKTTLSRMLADDLRARLVLEQFDGNSFLPRFYEDPGRFAFPLETSFLASRFNQLKGLLNSDLFAGRTIADYALYKSQVFARINLDEDEYHLFMKIFEIMEKLIPRPDLIVYLYRSPGVLLQNIKKRGRGYELSIKAPYLEKIHEAYMQYFRSLEGQQRILIIRAETLDYENRTDDYEYVRGLIMDEHQPGIKLIA